MHDLINAFVIIAVIVVLAWVVNSLLGKGR